MGAPLSGFVVHSEAEDGDIAADANVDLQKPSPAVKGAMFLLDADTLTGTSPTLDVKLQALVWADAKDATTDVWVDIPGASFPQITTSNDNAARTLTVYPGIAETANVSVSDVLPQKIRVVLDLGGTDTPLAPVTIVGYWLS